MHVDYTWIFSNGHVGPLSASNTPLFDQVDRSVGLEHSILPFTAYHDFR